MLAERWGVEASESLTENQAASVHLLSFSATRLSQTHITGEFFDPPPATAQHPVSSSDTRSPLSPRHCLPPHRQSRLPHSVAERVPAQERTAERADGQIPCCSIPLCTSIRLWICG